MLAPGTVNLIPSNHPSKPRHGERIVILQWAVFVGAGVVAGVVYRFVPWRDPVEVVGLPLVTGYTERAEQMGFYAFLVAVVVISHLLRPLTTRMTHSVWSVLGAFSSLLLLSLVAWCRDNNLLPLLLLGGGGSYFGGTVGALMIRQLRTGTETTVEGSCTRESSDRSFTISVTTLIRAPVPTGSWLLWCGGLTVWLWGSSEVRNLIGSDPRLLVASAGLFAGVLSLAFSRRGEWPRRLSLAVTMLVIAGGMWLSPLDGFRLGLCGAVCWTLGTAACKKGRPPFLAATQSPQWLEFLGLMTLSATMLFWLPGRWQEAVPRMLAGAGAAMSCVVLLKEFRFDVFREVIVSRATRFRVDLSQLALMAGTVPLVLVRPWLGTLLAGTVAWLWNQPRSPRPHARSPWLVLLMSLAFMATSLRAGMVLDEYHDGYALACLWEFENGRELYSEVFPLRSFEFYVGLLGQTILPATVEGYLFSLALLKFLPVAGVSLLILVWTRSPPWSFAAGMLCATLSRLDPRQGMQVVLVAAQLGLLMSPRESWVWAAVPCGVAACVGFDAFVTLTAATCITTFLVPSLRKRCGDVFSQWPFRMRATATYLAAAILPFTLAIGLWQGTESALSYWQVLFDYSQHFNAAYGIPFSWSAPEQRFFIVSNLLLLSLFTATTVFRWKSLSPRRQRAWCFLTMTYFLTLHRGLGRSDELHLRDSIYLTFALAAVGIVEVVRSAGRQGLASSWWTSRNVALLLGVLAAWSTKHASRGPFELVKYGSSLSSVEHFPLPRDEFLAQTLRPNETFWAIEQPLAHVANQRHGPTRHPLAHCIGSPSEQRRAVHGMRQNPPRLILWPASVKARDQWSLQVPIGWERQQRFAPGLPTADIMIGVDSVPSPLRYFIISQYVLHHYRPAEQPGYLVPAESDFLGFPVISADLNGPLRCGRLPLSWGESRLPNLGHRIESYASLPTWISTISPESDTMLPDKSPGWRLRGSVDPREINYLAIEVTASRTDSRDSSAAALTIRFATADVRDVPSEATLVLEADAHSHSYLVPIGCSPAWTWRSTIQFLELTASRGNLLTFPRVTALRVNDED